MKILCVITARGGSKGLRNKNRKYFDGRPLIEYTIKQVLAVKKYFYEIIVSTDDEKIIKISRDAGVNVPFKRPKKISLDSTPSIDVVKHALYFMEKKNDVIMDWVLILQPTSPLRTSFDIEKSLEIIKKKKCDTVVSVNEVNKHHPSKIKKIDSNGFLKPFSLNLKEPSQRQKLFPYSYQRNGAIYLTRRSVIEQNQIYGKKIIPYIMPNERSIDIDNKLDFEIAEFLYKKNY